LFISTQGINGFFFPDYQDKVFCLFFRGVLRGLVPGLLIALASGIGVYNTERQWRPHHTYSIYSWWK
jgi:hypothetical protein